MPGKTYNAGTIFLQVVPVFGDVQREIRREVDGLEKSVGDDLERVGRKAGERAGKAMGEEMEKGAEEAGEKSGTKFLGKFQRSIKSNLAGVQKELDGLTFDTLSDSAKENFDRVKRLAKDLDVEIHADMDDKKVRAKLEFLIASVETLTKGKHEVHVDSNLRSILAQFKGAVAYIDKEIEKKRDIEIGVQVDRKQAERALGSFEARVRQSAKRAADSLGDGLTPAIRKIKAELEALSDTDIGIDMDDATFRAKLTELQAQLQRLGIESTSIQIKVDAGKADAELATTLALMNKIDGDTLDVNVDVDTGAAIGKLAALRAMLGGTGAQGDATANSFRSFSAIALAAVTLLPALVPVLGAVGGGLLALGPILAGVGAGLGALIVGFSGIGDAISALGAQADAGAKDTAAAAKNIEAASHAVEDARRALADAERQAAQSIADARRSVADAERQAAQSIADARRSLADAERNAAQANQDAARAVADAREQAAEAIEAALDRQKRAQEAYRDSVDDVRDAEENLRDARQRAKDNAKDLTNSIADGALAIRAAKLAAFDATNTLNAVMADGSSTAYDQEAAQLAYDQAQQQLIELRQRQAEMIAEKKKGDKDGVNGSEEVKNAQEQLNDAIKAQQEAQEAAAEAAQDAAQAQIDAAEAISDALRDQAEIRADGARDVARAEQALQRAREEGARSVARAEQALQRARADGARAVARAQEALQRALEAQRDAHDAVGEAGKAAADKVALAMSKLGPAGQKFARFLFGLRDEFFAFRDTIQTAMLPGIQRALTSLISTYGPQFTNFMGRMGAVVGGFVESLAMSLQGPAWRGFFAIMDDLGPKMTTAFGDTTLNFFEAFASIMTAVAPFADQFSQALVVLSQAAADWSASEKGQNSITKFMEYAKSVGPEVADFFGTLARALGNLGRALAPLGELVLSGLTSLLDFIANMDPKTLTTIVTVIIGLIAAFQLAVGATVLVAGATAVLAGGIPLLILGVVALITFVVALALRFKTVRKVLSAFFGFIRKHAKIIGFAILALTLPIVAIGVALVQLYRKNELFRSRVNLAWKILKKSAQFIFAAISAAIHWVVDAAVATAKFLAPIFAAIGRLFVWLWENAVKPALGFIVKAFRVAFNVIKFVITKIFFPIIRGVGRIITWLWKNVVRPYLGFILKLWRGVFTAMKFVIVKILYPIFDLIAHALIKLWKDVVRPTLGYIGEKWRSVFAAMQRIWNDVLHPVIKAFGTVIGDLWNKHVKPRLDDIKDKWDTVLGAMEVVWRTVIRPVFNKFETAVGALKTAFGVAVDGIKGAWDRLKEIVAKPIRFVIGTVLNDGLIAGFNKVAKFVGSTEIDDIPNIPKPEKHARGGIIGRRNAYATGGTLPGYTPGRDVHKFYSPTGGRLELSGGEPIMRPEFGRVVGTGWVDRMNAAARTGGVNGVKRALSAGQRFAGGGRYWPLPKAAWSTYTGHDGIDLNRLDRDDNGLPFYAAGDGTISSTGYDRGYGNAIFQVINGSEVVYGHGSKVVVAAGQAVKAGQYIGNIGSTGNSSGPHLHFGFPGGTPSGALAFLGQSSLPEGTPGPGLGPLQGSAEGGGGIHVPHFPKWIIEIAKHPLDYVKNLISGPVSAIKDKFGSNGFVGQLTSIPGKLVGAVKDKIFDIIPKPIKQAAGVLGNVAGAVGDAAGAVGDAVNPFNGGYYKGGILPYNGTMKYDSGGYLPPGITSVVNATGRPEPVFTDTQFDDIKTQQQIAPLVGSYSPVFNQSDLTASEVMEEFEFTTRKIGRTGGKYEGAGR